MNTIANIGSLVVALPSKDIWLTDEQAADFLSYGLVHFKSHIICLGGFPSPRYITSNTKGRRWNLANISKWLETRPETTKNKLGRPRNNQRGFLKGIDKKYHLRQIYAKV